MLWAATFLVAAQTVPRGTIVASRLPAYGFHADPAGARIRLREGPALRSGKPGALLLEDEYPPAAQRDMRQGIVHLRFVVDAEGRVSHCDALSRDDGAGSAALRGYSCAVIARRAHFLAARDSRGQPVSAMLRWTVYWTIPKGWKPPPQPDGVGPPISPI